MAGSMVTIRQLRDFLGVDSDKDEEIDLLRASAMESLNRATGIDWSQMPQTDQYNEAVRVQVWLSYYAVRDAAKNTQFLQDYLSGLIGSLQLCRHEMEAGSDGV